ncbi:linear amide C-N hydrolase, partial [Candidatus Eisenbacteria bacterium]
MAFVWLSLLNPVRIEACSTFVLKDGEELVFGKNFDWFTGLGMVVVNKRGVEKIAAYTPEQNPARWVSRHGSITFNQVGREYPFGGMNEAGLVVEQMWLEATEYPEPDSRPVVGELQWIQYQLDNFESVAEVIASDSLLRIRPGGATLHYLVCDREGNSATVEFIDGKMIAHTGEGLPASVLTNSTYAECSAYLEHHMGFGGSEPIPGSPASEDRFVRAAGMIESYLPYGSRDRQKDPVEYAFKILDSVAQGDATRWSIVYDIPGGWIHFRTRSSPHVKAVGLDHFDFECGSPVKILDINSALADSVSEYFEDYTRAANRSLVEDTFERFTEAGFFGQMPSDATIERMAGYPETLPCASPEERQTTD